MEIYIDISKIVTKTLENYPSCTHLEKQFETVLQGHFEVLQRQLELGLRVGGLRAIMADYEKVLKSHKANFLQKDWSKLNVFGGGTIEDYKAEREVELQFFQSVVDWFNKDEKPLSNRQIVDRFISNGNEYIAAIKKMSSKEKVDTKLKTLDETDQSDIAHWQQVNIIGSTAYNEAWEEHNAIQGEHVTESEFLAYDIKWAKKEIAKIEIRGDEGKSLAADRWQEPLFNLRIRRFNQRLEELSQEFANTRNTLFEMKVALFLKGKIDDFEQRFSNSMEKTTLVELELQEVNQWLTDKKLSGCYVFISPTGSKLLFTDLSGLARKEGEDANLFPYWYNKLIVHGRAAIEYIRPTDENENELTYPVAVHVLYQYKQFLESRLTLVATYIRQKAKKAPLNDLPTFEAAIKESKNLSELWVLLSEMENPFVTEDGYVIGGKKARKHREVMALSQIITPLMKEGYGQFEVYSMLCKRVVLDESGRPDRLPGKPGYNDIRLTILAAIGAVLK